MPEWLKASALELAKTEIISNCFAALFEGQNNLKPPQAVQLTTSVTSKYHHFLNYTGIKELV